MRKKRNKIEEWYKNLPSYVQEKVKEYPIDQRYRLKSTGQIVSICTYEENDGKCETCKIIALAKDSRGWNKEDRLVFGIPFEELEPLN